MAPAFDSATFRNVLGHYPTGVCIVTADEPDGGPVGMVVGSFTSVSLEPPLVAFFPDRRSSTWPRIERAGRFCVNVLSRHQQALSRRFAATRGPDRFAGLELRRLPSGSPVLPGIVAWIDCALAGVHPAGDHFIAVGVVQTLEVVEPDEPLLFFRGGYGGFSPGSATFET